MSAAEAKGPKLPYFHRSLTPEDAALIGDIRPKVISTEASPAAVTTSGKVTSSSAWNGAQTWEERNCTTWGKEKLPVIISNDQTTAGNGFTITFTKLDKIEGHSSITHSRGKARFLYEWTLTVKFEAQRGGQAYKGTAIFSDVINDQLDDIETEVTYTGASPVYADGKVVKDLLKGLVIQKVRVYEEEFRNIA
ncbi:hypothetical protein EON65_21890 [archaeon]|nr:MAG: hypothetical protein EON65_21890 [archaeon]